MARADKSKSCPERKSKIKTKDGLTVAAGLLAILLGAMPLNGYFGYLRDASSFHQDAFIGGAWHLLAGMVPFGAGILLLAFSKTSTRQISAVLLCGVAGGLVLSLSSIITGNDCHPWLGWLAIVAVGWALAVLIRLTRSTWHHQTLNPTGNSLAS